MAAAAVSQQTFSLNTQTSFPIRLGNSILKPTDSKRLAGVRYNHKPRLAGAKDVKWSIQTNESEGEDKSELRIKDNEREWAYTSMGSADGDRYVLLTKGNGKDVEMVLEKLQSYYDFNLTRTPDEKSTSKLAKKYPQLPEDSEPEQDIFGDDDATQDEPRDVNNPFDYRNYLKSGSNTIKTKNVEASRDGANTPLSQPRPASTTPHSRPSKRADGPFLAQKKRKAQDNAKSNPKRVKAGTEPPPPEKPPSLDRNNIPRLRMDRKASLNPGELVLENETPVQEKPRSAMSLALTGQLDQGRPISLHSAASSPASRAVSPNPPNTGNIDDGEEFEIGDPDAHAGDDDADADVEDLALPSPAQTRHQPQRSIEEAVNEKPADDEDDLDAQLALAMAEEDDGGGDAAPLAAAAESDEESEEE